MMEIIKMVVWIIWGLVGITTIGMSVASWIYMKGFYKTMGCFGKENEVE